MKVLSRINASLTLARIVVEKRVLVSFLAVVLTVMSSVASSSLIINEFLADPASDLTGDSNGDGVRDATNDEFVELFNDSTTALDIGSWTISDAVGVRHTFGAGSLLDAMSTVVIFGGGAPTGTFGGALVDVASTGSLGLNNGGDTISVRDDMDSLIASHSYGGEGGNNQSLTRAPDVTGNFQEHSGAAGSGGSLFSPGTGVDGTTLASPPPPNTSVIINEVLADPAGDLTGDSNGDGTRDAVDDEFIELFNDSSFAVDIGSWTISDAFGVRHTFGAGTLLDAMSTVVIFGGGTPTGTFGGALVDVASTGALGLNNGGDTISIKDDMDRLITSLLYGSEAGNNQSLTRAPDVTGNFQEHSGAAGSGGTLFSPGTGVDGTIITTPPTPNTSVVINEVLADPAADLTGDSNGDGVRDALDDEFIELFNDSSLAVDIGSWTLSDSIGVRHTFGAGTLLDAMSAFVVFGGGTPTGTFGGALVDVASTGSLGLNNGGDTISLKDDLDTLIASFMYGSEGGNNQSLTRSPDVIGNFREHSGAAGSGGTLFSPGTRLDGTNFGSGPIPVPVPVASTITLFLLGAIGLGWSRRKKS